METGTVPPPPEDPQAQPRTPLWEDFVDVYAAPAQLFRRRAAEPVVWVPLLVLTLLVGLLTFAGAGVLEPMYDAEFERGMREAMRDGPQLPAEEIERMRSLGHTFALVFGALGTVVGALVLGLVVWAVARLFGTAPTLAAAAMVAVFAQFPRIPHQLAAILQGLLLSPEAMASRFALSVGPARFFDPEATSELAMVLLERLDLFTLWVTLLVGVGFHMVARLPRQQAAVAALIVWMLAALPTVIGAVR
jgi:hypothetical protein